MSTRFTCQWTEDEDGNHETFCGKTFSLVTGSLRDNGFKFCCFCGRLIKERPFNGAN